MRREGDLGPGILSRGEVVRKLRATSQNSHPRLPDSRVRRRGDMIQRSFVRFVREKANVVTDKGKKLDPC